MLLGSAALGLTSAMAAWPARAVTAPAPFDISTPMAPPEWALLERALLDAHTAACEAFFARYFDPRTGYLRAIERWGGNDGPDDAIENVNDWPHIYQLGGSERIRQLYELAYEGHVRQFAAARTTEVPIARQGMYFRDFPVMMDWQHNGEGMSVFNVMGLGNPYDKAYRDRVRRFADFYTGADPTAPNYDPKHKIIRSLINGSRGPLMRKATPLDWAGDPIDLSGIDQSAVFHGERNFDEMLAHFKGYEDVIGDHPLNLQATGLATNAYMLSNEPRYRDWVIEYVDAWIARAKANNDLLPTNIGLDGTIGGTAGGKWYGGVYGWGFSPIVPMTGKPADRNRIPYTFTGFLNPYLLTGDDKYLDAWRRMTDRINANGKMIDGRMHYPTMYGDSGWYGFKPQKWAVGAQDIYLLTMKPSDRARAPDHPFFQYLDGKNPGLPVRALREALAHIRETGEMLRADTSTPDTRFADTVMDQNPASITPLIVLMQGGSHIARPGWSNNSPTMGGALQFSRLRYFDPEAKRPGVPPDVAALVDTLTADETGVTLVNLSQSQARTMTIQGGAYGEHQILSVSDGGPARPVDARAFTVRLEPGAGARLMLRMRRFANQPTLDFPWGGPLVDDNLRRPQQEREPRMAPIY
ncbi:hypothetical protein PQ455_05890 [Sphingomonas naphthae]|uniref:Uncharacterized protein n=1 Tax=Sphingomonas naphthae TaxID=1813468 RepID=A0ABY7TSB0_9SPHN|nr:hypothetical protein [Sphingomonas naphthae]WCT74754.1 hypothetical protein PQ455_05890 [Sphingomonas naphthae]